MSTAHGQSYNIKLFSYESQPNAVDLSYPMCHKSRPRDFLSTLSLHHRRKASMRAEDVDIDANHTRLGRLAPVESLLANQRHPRYVSVVAGRVKSKGAVLFVGEVELLCSLAALTLNVNGTTASLLHEPSAWDDVWRAALAFAVTAVAFYTSTSPCPMASNLVTISLPLVTLTVASPVLSVLAGVLRRRTCKR